MKTIRIIAVFLFSYLSLYSQNASPAPLNFGTINGINYGFLNCDSFPQTSFIIGWQWSFDNRIADELLSSANHSQYNQNPYNFHREINTIPIIGRWDNWQDCQSFTFKAALKINNHFLINSF
jgi:hypothetical protein